MIYDVEVRICFIPKPVISDCRPSTSVMFCLTIYDIIFIHVWLCGRGRFRSLTRNQLRDLCEMEGRWESERYVERSPGSDEAGVGGGVADQTDGIWKFIEESLQRYCGRDQRGTGGGGCHEPLKLDPSSFRDSAGSLPISDPYERLNETNPNLWWRDLWSNSEERDTVVLWHKKENTSSRVNINEQIIDKKDDSLSLLSHRHRHVRGVPNRVPFMSL